MVRVGGGGGGVRGVMAGASWAAAGVGARVRVAALVVVQHVVEVVAGHALVRSAVVQT